MCIYSTSELNDHIAHLIYSTASNRSNVRLHRRNRKTRMRLPARVAQRMVRARVRVRSVALDEAEGMEMKNLKLYMENHSIKEQNDKLREKALLLDQENRFLISQLRDVMAVSVNGPVQCPPATAPTTVTSI